MLVLLAWNSIINVSVEKEGTRLINKTVQDTIKVVFPCAKCTVLCNGLFLLKKMLENKLRMKALKHKIIFWVFFVPQFSVQHECI